MPSPASWTTRLTRKPLAAAGKAAHADGFSEAAVVGRYREFLRSVADGSLQP